MAIRQFSRGGFVRIKLNIRVVVIAAGVRAGLFASRSLARLSLGCERCAQRRNPQPHRDGEAGNNTALDCSSPLSAKALRRPPHAERRRRGQPDAGIRRCRSGALPSHAARRHGATVGPQASARSRRCARPPSLRKRPPPAVARMLADSLNCPLDPPPAPLPPFPLGAPTSSAGVPCFSVCPCAATTLTVRQSSLSLSPSLSLFSSLPLSLSLFLARSLVLCRARALSRSPSLLPSLCVCLWLSLALSRASLALSLFRAAHGYAYGPCSPSSTARARRRPRRPPEG